MTPRTLTLVNAAGCLVLIGLILAQWGKERLLHGELTQTRAEMAAANNRAAEEAGRRTALERDIGVLKEAITATQQAAETATRELGEKATLATTLEAELKTAREQVTAWETALKARDERIQILSADLATTRKRLDEAVARLKAAVRDQER
jgi:chromosome segregation ATPase